MINYLYSLLEKEYNIITATNGIVALNKLKSDDEVDIVLSDVMMPEMDGYELSSHIRSDCNFEGLPIILLTAKSNTSMKLEGIGKGATDYIIKPFNPRELLVRIKAQLELKLLRDKLFRSNKQLYMKLTNYNKKEISVSPKKKIEFII